MAHESSGDFYQTFAPSTYLSSIVLHELLVGANTEGKNRSIQDALARPLRRARRVITPSHGAWQMSAEAIARMTRKEKRETNALTRESSAPPSSADTEAARNCASRRNPDRIWRAPCRSLDDPQ